MVKHPPTDAGDTKDPGSIPGPGRSPAGNSSPLQYSCLGNPMDGGARQAAAHRAAGEPYTTEHALYLIPETPWKVAIIVQIFRLEFKSQPGK